MTRSFRPARDKSPPFGPLSLIISVLMTIEKVTWDLYGDIVIIFVLMIEKDLGSLRGYRYYFCVDDREGDLGSLRGSLV